MTGVDIYSQRVPDKKKIDEFIERRAKAAGIGKGEALAQVIDEAIARDLIGEHIAYGSQLATIEKLTGDIEKTVQALIIENEHARAELAKVRTDAAAASAAAAAELAASKAAAAAAAELAQAKFEAFKEHTAHALAAADERAHSLDAECNAAHKACARAKQQAEAARAKTASLAAELAAARAEAEAAKKQAERMADLLERLNTPAPSGGGKLEMTQ